jgi:hypothetical protein
MSLFTDLRAWADQAEWRTWMFHLLIVFGIAFGGALLGSTLPGWLAIGYYCGREHIVEGGTYTRDRIMDAISATVGGAAGLFLGGGA